ncbi:uncharacterized protein LOC133726797 [Rosa rugosa]|uniref:uncharacterized protein LOC133726797 n=1 Tax=Rosa rugosa TaxID=74645 RepID=UPI002B4173B8|nr:uncharacterized protein LOC133726797 [Rosa rugosa]
MADQCLRQVYNGGWVMVPGVQWRICDGSKVNIWHKWIPNCQQFLIPKPDNCIFEYVSDLIDSNTREWMTATIHAIFSPEVAQQVLCIPLGRRNMEDKLIWGPEKKGFYSVKTTYLIARASVLENVLVFSSNGNPFKQLWNIIWKAQVPGKVKICIWRACCDLLPTRAKLCSKGYTGDLHCLLCAYQYEDNSHVFCKCPVAVSILTAPPFNLGNSLLPNIDFREWMLDHALNLQQNMFEKLMMVLWSLWKNRNDKLWNDTCQPAHVLMNSAHELSSLAWIDEFCKARQVEKKPTVRAKTSWIPAPDG